MSSRTSKFKSSNGFCADMLYTLAWIGAYLISFGFAVIINPLTFSEKFPLVCVVGKLSCRPQNHFYLSTLFYRQFQLFARLRVADLEFIAICISPFEFSILFQGNYIQIYVAFTATINSYGFSSSKGQLLYNVWHRIENIDRGLDKIGRIDTIDFVRLSTHFQNICMLIGVLVYALIIIYDNWIFSA